MKRCCICNKEFDGYGNNPYPFSKSGECCDQCNSKYVIRARITGLTPNKVMALAAFYTREELNKIQENGYDIEYETGKIYYSIGLHMFYISKQALERELKIGEYGRDS